MEAQKRRLNMLVYIRFHLRGSWLANSFREQRDFRFSKPEADTNRKHRRKVAGSVGEGHCAIAFKIASAIFI